MNQKFVLLIDNDDAICFNIRPMQFTVVTLEFWLHTNMFNCIKNMVIVLVSKIVALLRYKCSIDHASCIKCHSHLSPAFVFF